VGELPFGLEKALFECADAPGRFLQPTPELGDLVFCLLGPPLKLV
jgi:hypothetical protein